MKRLDRYILKELSVPLFVGTVIIALLFVANEFIRIFKDFELQYFPPISVIQLVVYRMPQWLVLTLPVGTAIGAALAMSRLSRETEITALRAAGVPVRRMMWPILLAGIVMSLANLAIVELVLPVSSQKYKSLAQDLAFLSYQPTLQQNAFFQLSQRYLVSLEQIERRDDGSMQMVNAVILEKSDRGDELQIYKAANGTYKDGVWDFPQASIINLQGKSVVVVEGQHFVINEPISLPEVFNSREPEEITAQELWKSIQESRRLGQNPRQKLVAFHVKFSVPASCIIFALTSAMVAVWMSRAGPFVGLLLSLTLVLLYYNAYVICTQIFGRMGIVEPWLAAWLPNFAYILLAVIAARRIR